MDKFCVDGGHRLIGEVAIDGAKNAALPIMAAALMLDGPVVLDRIPQLLDVMTMTHLLRSMGAAVDMVTDTSQPHGGGCRLQMDARAARSAVASYDLVRRMRASVCVLGPLLARFGRARVSLPGGCDIGHRPIDLHLKGLAALGADLRLENGYVLAEASRLRGADIVLSGPQGSTVTGTCNVLAAAVTARGRTVIQGAACEPEVCDLGHFLVQAGADIQGLGTPTLEIRGVEQLGGVHHRIMTDRIEAATLAIAAAITGGDVLLHDAPMASMASSLSVLREVGVRVDVLPRTADGRDSGLSEAADRPDCSDADRLRITCPDRLSPVEVVALPYPGLPTDVQAQLTALLTLVPGVSVVIDRVFPDRFRHAAELIRMGADIRVSTGTAVIRGQEQLTGAVVMASDLRASAALVLAALVARGHSEIRQVSHLDRGYAAFEQKLNALGARIQRLPDTTACGSLSAPAG